MTQYLNSQFSLLVSNVTLKYFLKLNKSDSACVFASRFVFWQNRIESSTTTPKTFIYLNRIKCDRFYWHFDIRHSYHHQSSSIYICECGIFWCFKRDDKINWYLKMKKKENRKMQTLKNTLQIQSHLFEVKKNNVGFVRKIVQAFLFESIFCCCLCSYLKFNRALVLCSFGKFIKCEKRAKPISVLSIRWIWNILQQSFAVIAAKLIQLAALMFNAFFAIELAQYTLYF